MRVSDVVKETEIKGTEAGRRDYSRNIELSTVPVVRSHQFRETGTLTATSLDIGYNQWLALTVSLGAEYVGDIYSVHNAQMGLSVSNLIDGYFCYLDSRDYSFIGGPYAREYGYGGVDFTFENGIPINVPHKYLRPAIVFRNLNPEVTTADVSYRIMGMSDELAR